MNIIGYSSKSNLISIPKQQLTNHYPRDKDISKYINTVHHNRMTRNHMIIIMDIEKGTDYSIAISYLKVL